LIFAATRGHLTNIDTVRLQQWANGFVPWMHAEHADIPKNIAETKQLSDDNAKALAEAIDAFNKTF
jgi:F-type H+/Na+-transporting ATPase subunit alpha